MKWLDKKTEILEKVTLYNGKPLFSFIEFNLTNFCNRNCRFCPTTKPTIKIEMDEKTYIRSMLQLKSVNFQGLIGWSGFCEPLLHPDIKHFVELTKYYLPNCTLVINTNGDKLDDRMAKTLTNSGVDYIIVSAYDVMTFDRIEEMVNDYPILINERFLGDMLKNNRAGTMKTEFDVPLYQACYYPFYMLYIDVEGDVLFCSHNYSKHNILGNIKNERLIDIWHGDKLNNIRYSLTKQERKYKPCSKCDVCGLIMGVEIYEEWKS